MGRKYIHAASEQVLPLLPRMPDLNFSLGICLLPHDLEHVARELISLWRCHYSKDITLALHNLRHESTDVRCTPPLSWRRQSNNARMISLESCHLQLDNNSREACSRSCGTWRIPRGNCKSGILGSKRAECVQKMYLPTPSKLCDSGRKLYGACTVSSAVSKQVQPFSAIGFTDSSSLCV